MVPFWDFCNPNGYTYVASNHKGQKISCQWEHFYPLPKTGCKARRMWSRSWLLDVFTQPLRSSVLLLYQVCGTGCLTSVLNIDDNLLLQPPKVRGGRVEKRRGPGKFHHNSHPTAPCAPSTTAPPAYAPHVSTNPAPACSPAFYTTDAGVSSQRHHQSPWQSETVHWLAWGEDSRY